MSAVNKEGRIYIKGKAISPDFRETIIGALEDAGAPAGRANFKGKWKLAAQVGQRFQVTAQSVVKYWNQNCLEGNVNPKSKEKEGRPPKLQEPHLDYIDYLYKSNPSMTQGQIIEKLKQRGCIPDGIHQSTISRTIRKKLDLTRKRVSLNNERRFTPENLAYTQAFMDELYSRDPHTLKFFDEAGFKIPDSIIPTYGYSQKGVRCVVIERYAQSPNYTLNLMLGTSGVMYANTVDGASTGLDVVNFFHEAVNSYQPNGEPILQVGDTVVMDNCPTHHGNMGRILKQYFATLGIEIIYTPTYSPEFNPVEFGFNKLKTMVKQEYYRNLFKLNAEFAIYECLSEISASDCVGFYRKTGYLDI